MDTFEQLFCNISGENLSMVPGPGDLHAPMPSISVEEVAQYFARDIVETLKSIENVVIEEDGTRSASRQRSIRTFDWWEIRWRWSVVDDSIAGDFTLLEDGDDPLWGGSNLRLECTCRELLLFWQAIRRRHPAIYLHDADCLLHTPESFIEKFALPLLEGALVDSDPFVREYAQREQNLYREIVRV
jgi:hypothetical protein